MRLAAQATTTAVNQGMVSQSAANAEKRRKNIGVYM